MLGLHSGSLSLAFALLGASSVGACGGRLVDELPPLPPPNTPPIVATPPAPAPTVTPARPATPAPRPAPAPNPARAVAPAPPEPAVRCAFSGRAELAPNTPIQAADGRAIGRFSGASVALSVSELTLATTSRARLETGTPRGSFRIRGFLEASKLPLFAAVNLPIAAGHLWIGAHSGVSIQAVTADRLKVQRAAAPPLAGSFTIWTTCSALSLDAGTPPGWSPPGDARGYALRNSALELFDAPQGNSVGVLNKAPAHDAVLFFSTEQSGGFVHLQRHGDIIVDAWAKAQALSALPRGETLDQLAGAASSRGVARLALPGEPRVVRTTREVPLRASAGETEPPIGVIAPDTETYVVYVMAGWVSVLPKALDVLAAERGQFWAKKADLGL